MRFFRYGFYVVLRYLVYLTYALAVEGTYYDTSIVFSERFESRFLSIVEIIQRDCFNVRFLTCTINVFYFLPRFRMFDDDKSDEAPAEGGEAPAAEAPASEGAPAKEEGAPAEGAPAEAPAEGGDASAE